MVRLIYGIGPEVWLKAKFLLTSLQSSPREREVEMVCHLVVRPWKVFMDSASSAMEVGVGIVIIYNHAKRNTSGEIGRAHV